MIEYSRGDVVRIGPDAHPHPGELVVVQLVDDSLCHGVSVDSLEGAWPHALAYAPDELVPLLRHGEKVRIELVSE